MKELKITIVTILLLGIFISCTKNELEGVVAENTSDDNVEGTTNTNTGTSEDVENNSTSNTESIYDLFHDNVIVSINGDYVTIESDGTPDHGSPYYDTDNSLYEAYDGDNPDFNLNPNRIAEASLTLRVPLNPAEANNKEATPMGVIGIARNGVAFFNQYAAGNSPLTNEINSFDQYNGHPQQTGLYHYHIEPLYLTEIYGRDAFLGVLLDGFPVYGPEENGRTVTNDDLDEYHGHFGPTPEYPDGIYHYHITDEDPYLNGDGFYGTKGTVSQ